MVGDPLADGTHIGPVISQAQHDAIVDADRHGRFNMPTMPGPTLSKRAETLVGLLRQGILIVLWILAVLMVLASVVGAYYYLRVIWYMYFEEGEDKAVLQASMDTRLVLSLNSVAVLALGVVPGWLLAMCVAILG